MTDVKLNIYLDIQCFDSANKISLWIVYTPADL